MPAPKFTQCGGYRAEELFAYKKLRTAEYELALGVAKDTCAKVLFDNLIADATKLAVHSSLVFIASTVKGYVALLPLFQLSRNAREYVQEFLQQCPVRLEERKAAGLEIPSVPECIIAAGDQLVDGTNVAPHQAHVPDCDGVQSSVIQHTPQRRVPCNVTRRSRPSRNFARVLMDQDHREYYLADFRGPDDDDLAKLCHVVGQERVVGWREGLPKDTFHEISKLGEGAYGEVFRTTYNGEPVAMKILPFTNHDGGYTGKVNNELLKGAALMIPEYLVTKELSDLARGQRNRTANFVGLVGALVVRGVYPDEFLDAWDSYALAKSTENDRPDQYGVEDQLFLCIALTLGGSDLESYTFNGEEEATSVVLQTMWALRVAEQAVGFEHRDLHVGNVLVEETDEEFVSYLVGGEPCSIRTFGVRARIIDFSLSRMERGTVIYYNASSDPELFLGDANNYQFELYRMMRANNEDDWARFCPKSNVFWVHYLSRMCILDAKFAKRTLKKTKNALQAVFDRILTCNTLEEFIIEDEVFCEKVLQRFVV